MTPTADYGSLPPPSGERPPPRQGGHRELRRHLSLFDLVCVGVGATVGSGIFVLVGFIAKTQAGPAVGLSWLIAGLAACASGLCFAELGGRFPAVGSSYVYAKETMGDCAAMIAGACLTLEYTGSASAVARSWGDKVVAYARTRGDDAGDDPWYRALMFALDPGLGINPCAFLVTTGAVLLLLGGVKESKNVNNFFSTLKIILVIFMASMSLILSKRENMTPFVPPEFGVGGIIRGATSSFFGYIGFDEICCLSGEAINPSRDIPRAIIITLMLVTSLYCAASIGLAGMVPYPDISETSGFPDGFRYRGYHWAAEITALGELVVFPLVVLVTIMAQPRLNLSMAKDGRLPPVFADVDAEGNPKAGTKISGLIMIVVATVVPFAYLDDLISSGILIAFTLTDMCVILVRQTSPPDNPHLLERMLTAFLIVSLLSGFLLRSSLTLERTGEGTRFVALLLCACTLFIGNKIRSCCPRKQSILRSHGNDPNSGLFLTPCVPVLPLVGAWVNLYLIAQLEMTGLAAIAGYVGFAIGMHYYNLHK